MTRLTCRDIVNEERSGEYRATELPQDCVRDSDVLVFWAGNLNAIGNVHHCRA